MELVTAMSAHCAFLMSIGAAKQEDALNF